MPPSAMRNQPSVIDNSADDLYTPSLEEDDPFAGAAIDWMPDPVADEMTLRGPVPSNTVKEVRPDDQATSSTQLSASEHEVEPATPVRGREPQAINQPVPVKKNNGNGHGNGHGQHQLMRLAKVTISRTGDGNVDAERVGEVHRLMRANPGPDRFCFVVMARGEPLQLDFPNDSTTISDDLIDQLKMLPGVESVQVSMSL